MIQRKRQRIRRIFLGLLGGLIGGVGLAYWRGWYVPQLSDGLLGGILVLAVYTLSLLISPRR
jgi:hypothetical protein